MRKPFWTAENTPAVFKDLEQNMSDCLLCTSKCRRECEMSHSEGGDIPCFEDCHKVTVDIKREKRKG